MAIKRRKKASDINPFFVNKVDFDKAFPEIEELSVEVEETGKGITKSISRSIYTKDTLPGEYIDCSNPLCYRGGFSIGSILREMIRNKQTESEIEKFCKGKEGSPKGRRIYDDCFNCFDVKVSIKYKKNIQ